MKIQDVFFIFLFLFIIWRKTPLLAVFMGILFLIGSIFLFSFSVFFTAERLTWYAAAFILYAVVFNLLNGNKNENRH